MARASVEKRKHPRFPVQIRIQYRAADQFFTDYIQNLSLGGIFVETAEPLPVNTLLKVQFSLPSMDVPVVADGLVVHSVQAGRKKNPAVSGMGIRFSDLDRKSKKALDVYLKKLQSPSES